LDRKYNFEKHQSDRGDYQPFSKATLANISNKTVHKLFILSWSSCCWLYYKVQTPKSVHDWVGRAVTGRHHSCLPCANKCRLCQAMPSRSHATHQPSWLTHLRLFGNLKHKLLTNLGTPLNSPATLQACRKRSCKRILVTSLYTIWEVVNSALGLQQNCAAAGEVTSEELSSA